MTPIQLIQYYANLLILQYLQKPKAYAMIQALVTPSLLPQTTVQTLAFAGAPASGTFVLNYSTFSGLLPSAAINWNDPAATIQTKLRAITGLGSITVAGSIAAGLTVTFTGVPPIAPLLVVSSNTLQDSGSNAVAVTVAQTDVTLPVAMTNAFNLTGPNPAVGKQLDTLGKYAGVVRSGYLSSGPITLSDADFLSLIQFAILKNSAGSSLATIQSLLAQFFPSEVVVFDYANMQMSYMISSSIGSQNLVRLLVAEGLLMRPMGVQLGTTIYAPIINMFFGFRTYTLAGQNNNPFNSYTSYQTNWPWVSYVNGITT